MKRNSFIVLAAVVLFSIVVVLQTMAGTDEKSDCIVKLKTQKPTRVEVLKAVKSSKGKLKLSSEEKEDCWTFCEKVCEVDPGGVCNCDAQCYDCGGGASVVDSENDIKSR